MSEYKTGEQMAADNERLQEMMIAARQDCDHYMKIAYTLGVEAGIRWSAERIAGGGACEAEKACKTCPTCGVGRIYTVNDECEVCGATEKPASEPKPCPECGNSGVVPTKEWGEEVELRCPICGGTGKAKE